MTEWALGGVTFRNNKWKKFCGKDSIPSTIQFDLKTENNREIPTDRHQGNLELFMYRQQVINVLYEYG